MRWIFVGAFIGVGLAVALPATAGDGLRIETGEWEFTSKVNMPVGPGQPPMVRRECITEPEVTPDQFNAQNVSGCTFADVKSSPSEMSWTMRCPSPEGKVTGKGRVTSTGKTLAGRIAMIVAVESQIMKMDVDWTGKHLGACK